MRVIIRYFFRTLRLILTPVVLISEKLTPPKAVSRSAEERAHVERAASKLALYQFNACPFCIKVMVALAHQPTTDTPIQAG